MAEYIRFDTFPATATVGETKFSPARVIVTEDTLYVFMDTSSGPQLVHEERLVDYKVEGRQQVKMVLDGGDEAHVTKASGCGCGSQLRGLRPFPGVPLMPRNT